MTSSYFTYYLLVVDSMYPCECWILFFSTCLQMFSLMLLFFFSFFFLGGGGVVFSLVGLFVYYILHSLMFVLFLSCFCPAISLLYFQQEECKCSGVYKCCTPE